MFTNTSLFPDVNVWLALAHPVSPHYKAAVVWSESLSSDINIYFSRFTQLGLLRMLTTPTAMGVDVMTQSRAWAVVDTFFSNPNVILLEEPAGIEALFRRRTEREEVSPKHWGDAYIEAFAEGHGLTIVTFDKALAGRTKGSILLKS